MTMHIIGKLIQVHGMAEVPDWVLVLGRRAIFSRRKSSSMQRRHVKASVSVEDWKGDSGWTPLCGVRSGRAEHRLVDGDRIGALGDCE